jgi:hypothetical protein
MDNFDRAFGNVPVPASIEEAARRNGGTREEQQDASQEIQQAGSNQPTQEQQRAGVDQTLHDKIIILSLYWLGKSVILQSSLYISLTTNLSL